MLNASRPLTSLAFGGILFVMRFLARLLTILIFLLITCHLSLFTRDVVAQGEFQTDYKVNYTVNPNGRTDVTQNITLKNKTANFYADKFELKIGSTKVDNVKAQDATGPMPVDVKFENNVTAISVKFNQRVIGIDKSLTWTLTYSSSELATKSGTIWEISIPRVADSPDIGDYTANLTVPQAFGPIAFAVPSPKTQNPGGATQEFTFDKSQLTKSGIAMSFGDRQVFSFDLNYYLENNNLTSQFLEIALPPDNNYQKVILDKIDPEPVNVTLDSDGNFLASYRLTPKQKLDIRVSGSVEVFSKPIRNLDQKLTKEEKNRYTEPQKYWEVDNPFIRDKAQKLKNPQEIYDFTTNFLSYNEARLRDSKIERKGAAAAVLNPKDAVCMEFTDLFITIARSAGIPAREVEGFAYTQNERLRPLSLEASSGDLLHAWPEYWDETSGWVQVDPTWGSTSGGLDYFNKLDFNHITFIQRGINSTYPFPAGAYKRENGLQKKSVLVSFAQEPTSKTSSPELAINIPSKVIAGVPVKVSASVKNLGNTSILFGKLSLSLNSLTTTSQNPIEVGILPPYSKRQATYTLQTKGFFTKQTVPITLAFQDKKVEKTVEIVPIYYLLFSKLFAVSVIAASLIIILGFMLYKRYHKPRNGKSGIFS